MGISTMIELLQQKDKECIILVNIGYFCIARGKDALLLNKELNLKLNCLEKEVCKVGFPMNALEKYEKMIQRLDYSYVIYQYDCEKGSLEIKSKYKGKKTNKIKENQLNCYICKHGMEGYKKADKYIQAVANLYEKEEEQQREARKKL